AGIPIVPTEDLDPTGPAWTPSSHGEGVIKPAAGTRSLSTRRDNPPHPRQRAEAPPAAAPVRGPRPGPTSPPHPAHGRPDRADGETALIYLDGRFSHAVRKSAMLTGPDERVEELYRPEEISARQPGPMELAVADKVLATIVRDTHLLYARVDLLP